jgi:hypothetical protein
MTPPPSSRPWAIRPGSGSIARWFAPARQASPSTLSHHIKALVVAGLITQVRDATTLVCHANYTVMNGLVEFLVAECCADAADNITTDSSA